MRWKKHLLVHIWAFKVGFGNRECNTEEIEVLPVPENMQVLISKSSIRVFACAYPEEFEEEGLKFDQVKITIRKSVDADGFTPFKRQSS